MRTGVASAVLSLSATVTCVACSEAVSQRLPVDQAPGEVRNRLKSSSRQHASRHEPEPRTQPAGELW